MDIFLLILNYVLTKYTTFGINNCHPLDTRRILNKHKTFRSCTGRLLNVLVTFNIHPASEGDPSSENFTSIKAKFFNDFFRSTTIAIL